jgi:hypothetical protein
MHISLTAMTTGSYLSDQYAVLNGLTEVLNRERVFDAGKQR